MYMKKLSWILLFFFICVLFACNKNAEKGSKAQTDTEFAQGSRINAIVLSKEKTDDLYALGLIWGFLKYYHPNVAAGRYNWDFELFRILPKVIEAESRTERDKHITEWIKNLGRFEVRKELKEKKNTKIKPDLNWMETMEFAPVLKEQLLKVKKAKRTGKNHYVGLLPNVGNPDFKNENSYADMKYPDTGFRLLSLYRYWNIIQYYFPYKNLIEEDWKDVLYEFIPSFLNASDELEYKLITLQLIARIHDTHANILGPQPILYRYWGMNHGAPILKFVEDKAIVSGFHDKRKGNSTGLKVGDIITKIDHVSVEDIITDRLPYTPASNYPTQLRDIAKKLLRTNNESIEIEYVHNKKVLNHTIEAYSGLDMGITKYYPLSQDTCFQFIRPDIAYLYLGTIKNEHLPKIMDDIKNTKGLIIDLRPYPSDFMVFSLGAYLMPQPTEFVKFTNGSISEPGYFTFTPSLKVGERKINYYNGKIVILNNEDTQSQAEYTTMALRISPNATVIGSTTAAADGNVSSILLPGGIETRISGIGVYYPDGKETQRIGIIPDIEVKPTIEGVRAGKDELIEKAIEIIYSSANEYHKPTKRSKQK